jgi:hypothetical protein
MRFRHTLVLAILFVVTVALGVMLNLPPLLETLRFTLVIAIPVAFLLAVRRPLAFSLPGRGAARAKRRKYWIRGAVLFAGGALDIALTLPFMGANSTDAIILVYGLGVVSVLASYILLLALFVELIAGPLSGPGGV